MEMARGKACDPALGALAGDGLAFGSGAARASRHPEFAMGARRAGTSHFGVDVAGGWGQGGRMDKSKIIRDAATVILIRQIDGRPHVLMGQRGKNAAFMPSKYVFPGGAVDEADHSQKLAGVPDERLGEKAPGLYAAAMREMQEETGLRLRPDMSCLRFVFRAITPPGRPRRFDARFFLAKSEDVINDPDDFSKACDELSHLHWIGVEAARDLALPFITSVVLSEVEAILKAPDAKHKAPFFYHVDGRSHFALL